MTAAPSPPCLLVTADDALSSEVLRLSAAAGVVVEVSPEARSALPGWSAAPAVLVGADTAAATARADLPRRERVHVVARGRAEDALFRDALALGASSVLELPAAGGWLLDLLSDLAEDDGPPGLTLGVVAGSGGAGASVLAAAVAAVAARTGPALLVDLDPLGPGADRLVGCEGAAGVGWRELADARGRLGSRALRDAIRRHGRLGVLGWPDEPVPSPSPAAVREVLTAASRGHRCVVVDLPRRLDELTTVALAGCDRVAVVARTTVPAVAATARLVGCLTASGADVGLIVRSDRRSALAQDVAAAAGVPLWGELTHQRRLDEHLDLGLGPIHGRRGPLADVAATLLRRWGVPS